MFLLEVLLFLMMYVYSYNRLNRCMYVCMYVPYIVFIDGLIDLVLSNNDITYFFNSWVL